MFNKISIKILLSASICVACMAAAIAAVSFTRISDDAFEGQKRAAHNILSLVTLNIQSQYNRLVDFEVEFISKRRELLKQKNGSIVAYFEALRQAVQNGEMTQEQAMRQSLAWLDANKADRGDFIVFNNALIVLAQTDGKMIGRTLTGYKNIRGGDAFAAIRDSLSRKREDYSVIFWPEGSNGALRKQLAFFTAFPAWGWTVAAIEPIDELEDIVASKRENIVVELGRTLSEITVPGSGYLFLFNGSGNVLTHPGMSRGRGFSIHDAPELEELFKRFKAAAATPESPLTYTWPPEQSQSGDNRKIAFVQYFKPLDWYLCYTLEESDLKAAAAGLIRQLLGIILLASCAGLAVMLYFTRRFTKPMVELKQLVRSMPEQEFMLDQAGLDRLARIARRDLDETGALAAAFLGLQEKLQRRLNELSALTAERVEHIAALTNVNAKLEAKVTERTANLVKANERLLVEMRERETATESLRASEEKFRALAESVPGIIYLSKNDAIFTKLYLNDFMKTVTGYPKEAFLSGGIGFLDIIHPDDRQHVLETARNAALGAPFRMEYRIKRKDGQWRWLEEYGMAMSGPNGETAFYEGVINDVTGRVHDRETLRAAKNHAEAASIAKSEFLASMSHEIRTPLHIILGVAEVLQDSGLPPAQAAQLEMLRSAGDSLLSLISDILDFSKIETGAVTLEDAIFDLRALIEEASRTLGIEAHKKQLEYIVNIAPNTPRALIGDPARIRQVFVNIVGNAIKFTGAGEVEARISCAFQPDGLVRAVFTVRDTGIGIPEDKLDLIFDRFTQADASTTREYGGSGLGLTICKRLVELMGGSIEARNAPDGGAVFSYELPLKVSDAAAAFDPTALTGMRILLMDENRAGLAVLQEYVEALGAAAVPARNPAEAMAALRQAECEGASIRAALVNPGWDEEAGFSFAASLRSENPALRVFMLAPANSLSGFVRKSSAMGLAGVLVKPAGLEDLRTRLMDCVSPDDASHARYSGDARRTGQAPPLSILVVDEEASASGLTRAAQEKRLVLDAADNAVEALARYALAPHAAVFLNMDMPLMDGFALLEQCAEMDKEADRTPAFFFALTSSDDPAFAAHCRESGFRNLTAPPLTMEKILAAMGCED